MRIFNDKLFFKLDKNLLMIDFVSNIKATPELAVMFENIQKDALSSLNEASSSSSMDTS